MTRIAALRVAIFIALLGVPDGAVGVLWPSLRTAFHRPIGDLGVLVVVMTALYVVGGIVFSRLSHLVPVPSAIRGSCVLSVAATVGWAVAGSWLAVLAAVAMFGLARGVVDSAVNAASAGRIRELGWLHAGWAIGGTLGPLLVAATVSGSHWREAVVVIASMSAVVTVAALAMSERDAATTAEHDSQTKASAATSVTVRVAAVFAAYTAAEAGPVAWGYVYLVDERHLHANAAALGISLLWLALVAGRIALGASGHLVDETKLLTRCCVVMVGALFVLWLAPTAIALIALPVVGLASAPVFPLLINRTPALVGTAETPRVVGIAVAAAAVGGPVAVLVEGQIADAFGVSAIAPCLVVAALMFAASCLGLRSGSGPVRRPAWLLAPRP
jgi:fucose permease